MVRDNLLKKLFYFLNFKFEKVADILKASIGTATGILDQNGFNFTVLTPSNSSKNPLPISIQIGGYCFGKNLDIIISQVDGNNSFIKSKIWQQGKKLSNPPIANTVIIRSFIFTVLIF
jgi:hypothetical protein